MALLIIPQAWVAEYRALPDGWLEHHAPALIRYAPNIPGYVRYAAQAVGVDERLLVTRMQLEQSAITYAWDGSTTDYGELATSRGCSRDSLKLRYLCGVDRTDSGDRDGGWFGAERQLLGCALRFRYWYRGQDGPREGWRNWLGLREDARYRAGVPVTRGGVTITPANQASADCLRYTSSMAAQSRLRPLGLLWFPEDYAEEESAGMASRNLTEAQFIAEMERAKAQGVVKHCTFLHNTATLTKDFRGASTIAAFDRNHRGRGYTRGLACHGYAAPDGTVWTARTFADTNCACQNPPADYAWSKVYAPLQALIERTRGSLAWRSWPNRYGAGFETVGNFSIEDPTKSAAMQTSLNIIAAAHRIWNIPVEHCFFHRDVAPTSCPGDNTRREWVHAELRKRLEGAPVSGAVKIILGTGPEPAAVIDSANARIEDGTLRADVRPLLEALGYTVHAQHVATQAKLYIEEAAG